MSVDSVFHTASSSLLLILLLPLPLHIGMDKSFSLWFHQERWDFFFLKKFYFEMKEPRKD